MTQVVPRLWVEEGVLSGQCACGAYLEQLDGIDEALVRRSFDVGHPVVGEGRRSARR